MFIVSLSSQATLLTIELNQDTYQVGEILTANFIISEIENDPSGIQKLLNSFEFEVSWDNAMLEYSSFSFGSMLVADPLIPSDYDDDVMASSLFLSQTTYTSSENIYSLQNGLKSFVLASVDFNVINAGNGSGTLRLAEGYFGTFFKTFGGFSDVSDSEKAYSVTSGTPVDVPEPSSIVLALMGLILLFRQRKMN